MLTEQPLARVDLDAIALKPTECDVARAAALGVDTVAIDYEGSEHLPSIETLCSLAERKTVYLTTPVRADGFDPLGDDTLSEQLPERIGRVLVAGNPAYLSDDERQRAVAPRLRASLGNCPDTIPRPWIGTEGIERLALAAGGVQYDLLSRHTARDVRSLRSVGFEGAFAVYAPTVLSTNDDRVLDAIGEYVARRRAVRRALPDNPLTDRRASGRTRAVLLDAARDFALVGDGHMIRKQVADLRDAGVDTVVGYPANGLDPFE